MLEESTYVRCLLIDFSKAFDVVDQVILMNKLKLLNLPDNIIKWVVSFLTNRDKFTKVGDKRSFTRIIMRSIVQGLGIGRTLFIIFIIDLQPIGHLNHMTKYADINSLSLSQAMPARVQGNSSVGTSLHHQLLHRSFIKTVPPFIRVPATPRSLSFQDGDARRTFILDRRAELMEQSSRYVMEADTVELFKQRLKTHLFGQCYFIPIQS